jgi:Cgr1 family
LVVLKSTALSELSTGSPPHLEAASSTTTMASVTSQEPEASDALSAATAVENTKGRNVSGRSWKTKPQKRASSLIKTSVNNLSLTWAQKRAARLVRQEALSLEKELKEKKRQAAILKKERRLENEKRRAENEYQAVQRSAQVLNHAKVGVTLKAMSKKQLRQVKKTRMNQKTGVVEFVPAYAK